MVKIKIKVKIKVKVKLLKILWENENTKWKNLADIEAPFRPYDGLVRMLGNRYANTEINTICSVPTMRLCLCIRATVVINTDYIIIKR